VYSTDEMFHSAVECEKINFSMVYFSRLILFILHRWCCRP